MLQQLGSASQIQTDTDQCSGTHEDAVKRGSQKDEHF